MNKESNTFPICIVVDGYRINTELPVSNEEWSLIKALPPCANGMEKDLKSQLPYNLYRRIKTLAYHEVMNWVIIDNFNKGYYNLDVHKWFQKDLEDEVFCDRVPNEKSIFVDSTTAKVYLRDDEELFELWQEYEKDIVSNQGVSYLMKRYGEDIEKQTDIRNIKWSLEF